MYMFNVFIDNVINAHYILLILCSYSYTTSTLIKIIEFMLGLYDKGVCSQICLYIWLGYIILNSTLYV